MENKNLVNNVEELKTIIQKKTTLLRNASTSRYDLMKKLLNIGKDINLSCGYPDILYISDYMNLYNREGISTRTVKLLPQESWAMEPEIKEDQTSTESLFEKEWKNLQKKRKVYHYLQRIDEISGIGEYGILLLGISDGKELSEPVEGINELTGEKSGNVKHKLLYLRPFDQTVVTIKQKEKNVTSPRFGQPVTYNIIFQNEEDSSSTNQTKIVHWTRVIHIADNKHTSDILGIPRLQTIYNRILDIRKILSGSGEMYWKGAYPGFALETTADTADIEFTDEQKTAVREEIQNYQNELQRSMMFQGLEVKSLDVQIADPTGHLEAQIQYLAMTLGCPKRVFTGSEIGQLSSGQDMITWNKRITKRRDAYITPWIIEPFVDRMIIFGILPEPKEYEIIWPDLNAPTDAEKATVAKSVTEAIVRYVSGGGEALIGPKEFLMLVMGFEEEEAEAIEKSAIEVIEIEETEITKPVKE